MDYKSFCPCRSCNVSNYSIIRFAVKSHDRDQEIDYLILSSFIYRLERVDESENEFMRQFYASLESDVEVTAVFTPFIDGNEPAKFTFDEVYSPIISLWQRERPGPVIKIYRLTPRALKDMYERYCY